MVEVLRQIIARNRAGEAVAIPSVCSAQPDVLRASILLAEELDRPIVVEATSNQVNQYGGYTGMRAMDFIASVRQITLEAGVALERITFGGDHLGPQAWRSQSVDAAMEKARVLVRDYVAAGFHKIHLDCSEGCAGEPLHLTDDQTAERSAYLAQACAEMSDDLLFVVGTEVPLPGGARTDESGDIPATSPEAARATVAAHAAAFGDLSELIGGLVVQPGVEFSPSEVHQLPEDRNPGLRSAMHDFANLTLEAHSTDYQDPEVFPRLAALGFAFQKVGPALTFAYREALYQLDAAAADTRGSEAVLPKVMERIMLANPASWKGHYHGSADELRKLRHTGLADRIRYYWTHPKAQAAVKLLMAEPISEHHLKTHVPEATRNRAERLHGTVHERILTAAIQEVLAPYFFAEAA